MGEGPLTGEPRAGTPEPAPSPASFPSRPTPSPASPAFQPEPVASAPSVVPSSPGLPTGNPATDFSIALLTRLVRLGVRHLVVAPGSRSQALALVAAELERVGAIELHVRIDERVAGFLALGLALESGAPAVVVTTSGTAVANLHPAVLEAHEARVPMIVVTADRPAELRGIRSNQTTTQAGVFGVAAGFAREVDADAGTDAAALAASLWAAAVDGPAHLNLALRDPLSTAVPDLSGLFADGPGPGPAASAPGSRGDEPSPAAGPAERASRDARPAPFLLGPGPRTVVVAGDKAGPAAEQLARAGGWPLLAEVSSGARFGPNLVVAYRELLGDPGLAPEFGAAVERAIVFGHPTLSREIPALLARADVEVIVVDDSGAADFYDPGHDARRVAAVELSASVDPGSPESRRWVGSWVFASRRLVDAAAQAAAPRAAGSDAPGSPDIGGNARRAAYLRGELAATREPVTRRLLADALWRYTWPHDRLVLGASRLIRELDGTVPGKKITVHANRGLGGIDGTVATGLGVALALTSPLGAPASPAPSLTAPPAEEPRSGVSMPAPAAPAVPSAEERSAAPVLVPSPAEERATARASKPPASPASRAPAGVTRVLLGDLTLLHDAGALLRTPGERMPPFQLIVGNDRGGTIFAGLEVAASAAPAAFERVQLTPRDVDLAALAQAYGWQYRCAATRGELDRALSAVTPEPTLIEVPLA